MWGISRRRLRPGPALIWPSRWSNKSVITILCLSRGNFEKLRVPPSVTWPARSPALRSAQARRPHRAAVARCSGQVPYASRPPTPERLIPQSLGSQGKDLERDLRSPPTSLPMAEQWSISGRAPISRLLQVETSRWLSIRLERRAPRERHRRPPERPCRHTERIGTEPRNYSSRNKTIGRRGPTRLAVPAPASEAGRRG